MHSFGLFLTNIDVLWHLKLKIQKLCWRNCILNNFISRKHYNYRMITGVFLCCNANCLWCDIFIVNTKVLNSPRKLPFSYKLLSRALIEYKKNTVDATTMEIKQKENKKYNSVIYVGKGIWGIIFFSAIKKYI